MAPTDLRTNATVTGAGTAVVTLTPTNRRRWIVSQVSVELASAPTGATCNVRKNGALVCPLVPQSDAAGGDPPITLNVGDKLTVEWAGCTAGALANVFFVYDDGTPQ